MIYVGATGLPPAVRAWLHLHDPDPGVGRVRAALTRLGSQLPASVEVIAFAVPTGVERSQVRDALASAVCTLGYRSEHYIGDEPKAVPAVTKVDTLVETIMRNVKERAAP